jgi:hypothetical protein
MNITMPMALAGDSVWMFVQLDGGGPTHAVRYATCTHCGLILALPAGQELGPAERWLTTTDLDQLTENRRR